MTEEKKKKPQNFRYFFTTRKFLLVAVGLCLGAVILFFSVIFPKIQDIQVHRSDLEKEQKKLDQLNQKEQLLANASGLTAFQEKNRVDAVLPNNKPLLPVIHRIEAISGESGVLVSGISLNPGEISTQSAELKKKSTKATSTSDTESMDIEMTISGDVEQINSFLALVNSMAPLTDLSSLTLNRARANTLDAVQSSEELSRFETKVVLSTHYVANQFQPQLGQVLPDLSKFDNTVLNKLKAFPIVETPTTEPTLLPDGVGKENLFE